MVDGVSEANPHLPALQQSQRVSQPATTESGAAEDPNRGNRTQEIQQDAIRQHQTDEAAKREERGQLVNVRV